MPSQTPRSSRRLRGKTTSRHPSKSLAKKLGRSDLVLLFAYAPAGLGHLRVTDALYRALPPGIAPLLLGSSDRAIATIHRLVSIHPIARSVMEWVQRGLPQELFTRAYRGALRLRPRGLRQQLTTLLEQRLERASTVLVVATHFGLAHQFAELKDQLFESRQVRLVLVVQVTDDSPQHIWFVPGADLILVPSDKTRTELSQYAERQGQLGKTLIEVSPYPLDPSLTTRLTSSELASRRAQLDPRSNERTNVCVPISGAAVGLDFTTRFMSGLRRRSTRFTFEVISKATPYLEPFLRSMMGRTDVTLHSSSSDHEVVRAYDEVYRSGVIALEVTKPSEQAFKALCRPNMRGGSLLLLSAPVGRQEYDNLDFLRRHQLLPSASEQQLMLASARDDQPPSDGMLSCAGRWRCLELPVSPEDAADLVLWARQYGLLLHMLECTLKPDWTDPQPQELAATGARAFWERVGALLEG